MIDDRTQHTAEPLDDLFLGFAQGRLVGNLEDAAARIRTLAEETTHDHAELVHGADDFFHLVTDHECRQMHHRGGAHGGAEVGGARGEVAQRR